LRYNANGSPDSSFGGSGFVDFEFSNDQFATAVAIQPDGKIIVAGSGENSYYSWYSTARYNTNGSVDSSFGWYGLSNSAPSAYFYPENSASAVVIQPDGKIV